MTILREELIARDDQEDGSEQVGNAWPGSRTVKGRLELVERMCGRPGKRPLPGPSRGEKIAALPRSEGEFLISGTL